MSMKKYVNGKYVKMTKAESEELRARLPEIPAPVKTVIERRVEALERLLDIIKKLLKID